MTSYLRRRECNQGPNRGTNAVILYHTGSEQLRKYYDNFAEIIFGVRCDVSNKDRQRQKEVFLNYTTLKIDGHHKYTNMWMVRAVQE